ncbi:hypothetical protein [Campylobacter sp. MG1]|uniref:hypothetical protein n=1 Tax=Campylobacter sp. MG1 TaxID=2976332 RepID=UPI00226D1247|nr:hypothetical protein [Campylobacter sp. MG1]
MKHYIDIPQVINYKDMLKNYYSFSSNTYKQLIMKNNNVKTLKECLERDLKRSDLGCEVGSSAYVKKSKYCFIKSRALQKYSFLPNFEKSASEYIIPQAFINMNLKENDVIISKDSNIGEVIILDKDYPNTMLSGALYKLPIKKNKFYILSIIKHDIFKQQLDFLVPKGATIRHAKTLFLDCKIPFPKNNIEQTIAFVEKITKSIINKEKLIRKRHEQITNLIQEELVNNQKKDKFIYKEPTIKDLEENARLDTGIHSKDFKYIEFLVKNYKNGYFFIDNENIKSGNTPEIRYISDYENLPYKWLTPTHFNSYGNIIIDEYIRHKKTNNIKNDCILLVNRGDGIDCGKSMFYCFKDFGLGHHNQGLYKVFGYDTARLIFILCFLNTNFMRKYCGLLTTGSKMKELKIEHFLTIPFPNFTSKKQQEISNLYYNPNIDIDYKMVKLDNFDNIDNEFCKNAGIYNLDKNIKYLKKILNSTIDKIINEEDINIRF